MNKEELLDFFISLFPGFEKAWKSEGNVFCENDNFTSHGVCAEFSHYFKDNFESFSDENLKSLFQQIEEIVTGDAKNENETTNALYTCFLENIAQTEAGNSSEKYLGKKSREYFNHWN